MFVQQHYFQQSLHQMTTFQAEAPLPLIQNAPAVTHDTIRLCKIDVTLWNCYIHADAVRALSWILLMHFLLSDGESPRLVKNAEVELVMKPRHPTSIGNTLVIQPFLIHYSSRSSYFFQLTLMYSVEIFFKKKPLTQWRKHFFNLTDQMTIS